MSVEIFAQKIEDLDLPMFNIKQNLAKKLDRTLKTKYFDGMTYLTHFFAQKSKRTRCFRDIDPEKLHTCDLHAHPEA